MVPGDIKPLPEPAGAGPSAGRVLMVTLPLFSMKIFSLWGYEITYVHQLMQFKMVKKVSQNLVVSEF